MTVRAKSISASLSLWLAACDCSGGGPARDTSPPADDASHHDAPAATDANDTCAIEPLEPPPNWGMDVTYDVVIEDSISSPDFPDGNAGIWHVFADAQGLAIFAWSSFIRADISGTVVGRTPYPDRLDGSGRVVFAEIAQGPTTYGAITIQIGGPDSLESRFCTLGMDGSADLSQCLVLGVSNSLPRVTWADAAYRVFDAPVGTAMMRMITSDETAAELASRDILPVTETQRGVVAAASAGDDLAVAILGGHDEGCPTMRGARLPLTGLVADAGVGAPVDLLEPDYRSGTTAMASSPTGAALMTGTRCLSDLQFCQLSTVYAGFVTVFAASGGPPVTRRVSFAGVGSYHMVWDGERYVVLARTDPLKMHFFDSEGAPIGVSTLSGLAYDLPESELIGEVGFAALAPGDYVVGYGVSFPGHVEHRIARVSVGP